MRFDCKEILISEEEFGCSITFSEKENGIAKENLTVEELLHYTGQYVMLMRKYSEDASEDDFLYIETPDPNKSGELQNFLMNLYPGKLSISYDKDLIEIDLTMHTQKFEEIKQAIKKITLKKGQLNIHD